MDAIIMCAGLGERLRPLTNSLPKPLVPVCGRSPLERTLDSLPPDVHRVILVIGYLGDMIRERIGTGLDDREVVYVTQDMLDGTGGALRRARFAIQSERFIVLNGDDLYDANDLADLSQSEHAIVYAHRIMDAAVDGWIVGRDGFAKGIERIESGKTSRMNAGAYALTHAWFDTEPVLSPDKTSEWSVPHAIPQLIDRGCRVRALEARFWMPVGTPEQLKEAEEVLDFVRNT
jgi:NDP-sugar pyrophosphorylase family protein